MLIFIGILLFGLQVSAQPQFKRYDTSSGLSNNIIHDVFQDSEGFLWIATENGLNRFDGHTFKVFKSIPNKSNSLSHNVVMAVFEDSFNNLWVGTWNGLNRFDRVTQTFTHYTNIPGHGDYKIGYNNIITDKEGHIWFPGPKGVTRFNPVEEDFLLIDVDADSSDQFWDEGEVNIYQTQDKSILIYNKEVVYLGRFDFENKQVLPLEFPERSELFSDLAKRSLWADQYITELGFSVSILPSEAADLQIEQIVEVGPDLLWIGTSEGVYTWNRNSNEFTNVSREQFGSGSLSQYVEQIHLDSWGSVWVGTRNGLYQYNPLKKPFSNIHLQQKSDPARETFSDIVMSLVETETAIWIGTLGSGLHRYDSDTGIIRQWNVSSPGNTEANQVWDIYHDINQPNTLWIATTSGVYEFDVNSKKGTLVTPQTGSEKTSITFSITKGNQNSIWVAADHSILSIDKSSKQLLEKIDLTPRFNVSTVQDLVLLGDSLFISTQAAGLLLYHASKKEFIPVNKEDNSFSVLNDFPIWDIYLSKNETLWLATGNGLYKYDRFSGRIKHFPDTDLESQPVLFSILEDDSGKLWLGSDNGLLQFNPSTSVFIRFDEINGLANTEFNRRSVLKTSDGNFLFGGTDGISYFRPEEILVNPFPPVPKITSFTLFDTEGSAPLFFDESSGLDLNWRDNTFEIEFTGITFTNPERTRFRYILENHDPGWVNAGNEKFARYSKIPPGKYAFRVEAANSDGIWTTSGLVIPISIHPPFWKSWWAYASYLMLFIGAVFGFVNWRARFHIKERERLETMVEERTSELESQKELALDAKRKIEIQAGQLKELDEMKSRFFANISHELRTPLTLIDAPLQQLLSSSFDQIPINKLERKLAGIQRNSYRLGKLIDELLDLSRLKENSIEVKNVPLNLRNWFNLFVDSYQSLALSKRISFRTVQEIGSLKFISIDVQKLDKITSNLINNALKFTKEGDFIEVTLKAENKQLVFGISDSGAGISDEDLPNIFNRFYKGKNQDDYTDGLGLGLALSKELANVMDGEITVESTFGEGSRFTLTLPLVKTEFDESDISNQIHVLTSRLKSSATILIVEDNAEMRSFLTQLLENDFEIYEAENGKQAIEKLKVISPNLILSDLMMPEMDGLELTRYLRDTPHYSHIPILMLTARSSDQDRLTSLRIGVDDYLSKPFIPEEVKVRAINLAENHKVRLYVSNSEEMDEQSEETELQIIQDLVVEHLADSTFNVAVLADLMHSSERQLYRTIQRLTGMTPLGYINSIRLNVARSLLINNKKLTIDLVAEQVGFKSRSHFSRLFKKAYGLSPGKYQSKK
ncbi:MAG: response regulator [Balneolaceae bacterium]|nr:response regulator [Balneolaceae bacterium]MBO6546088.1 response regulator [Balneolaceae bacterium]MBO6647484.1 response regulator [Balneolaceae bacterium]